MLFANQVPKIHLSLSLTLMNILGSRNRIKFAPRKAPTKKCVFDGDEDFGT